MTFCQLFMQFGTVGQTRGLLIDELAVLAKSPLMRRARSCPVGAAAGEGASCQDLRQMLLHLLAATAVVTGRAVHRNAQLNAPNCWQLKVPPAALATATRIFDEACRSECSRAALETLEGQPIPCRGWDTAHGRYFIMKAGSSTDAELVWASDLAWISVDDEKAFGLFSQIFDELNVRELVAPFVDTRERVRLYSSFFVVRSRCELPNVHTDWDDEVGTDAFTLLTPLDDYPSDDFQLLYEGYDATVERSEGTSASATDVQGLRQYVSRNVASSDVVLMASRCCVASQSSQTFAPHPCCAYCLTSGFDCHSATAKGRQSSSRRGSTTARSRGAA